MDEAIKFAELFKEIKKLSVNYLISINYQSGKPTQPQVTLTYTDEDDGSRTTWTMDTNKPACEQIEEALQMARDEFRGGDFYSRCHCGWKTKAPHGPGDPPQCPLCRCYTTYPGDPWNSGENCIVEKRKRYPYLESVDNFVNALPHKVEVYVKSKVGKEFNLTEDEVKKVFYDIEKMKEDKEGISRGWDMQVSA